MPDGLLLLGSGFRVSPWGVPLLDYDEKPHLNEKLEMRNAKWWCGASKYGSAAECK